MTKKKEKMIPIRVTARFDVTFDYEVTESQFKEMDKDELEVSDVVDESVAYGHLSNNGDCEMEWDYAVVPAKKKKK